MTSKQIREAFLSFYTVKNHKIVTSAPIILKNDPTLMFTNAGMNQFKDIFLENTKPEYPRVANSQKCLRVSGKHNDLEEVGLDTYHHTMFEMLGNWSFGDYFKKEAIGYAWEFLTDTLKINKNRLYATVFEGTPIEGVDFDQEAYDHWTRFLPEERILKGSKKDNFWEMGDTGPCGPCSEIHIDLRPEEELKKIPGRKLVNKDNPLVMEIWNLVFIQYNRKADGKLEMLPKKHVDTGMGFERLCTIIQGKTSNYDTDLFTPILDKITELSGIKYGAGKDTDIAMRVVADHLRTVAFTIADGQLPSNNKAGYVIRRILRRAIRYGYTFLGQQDPFIYRLVEVLSSIMGDAYPELPRQKILIEKVIKEEEQSFLRTLDTGLMMINQQIEKAKVENRDIISGKDAFELYDTYGFPLDLTELILRENNMKLNRDEFDDSMAQQKSRSKSAAAVEKEDWTIVHEEDENQFIGYEDISASVKITRYRKITTKNKESYQLILDHTPFYAESGGQVGDKGYLVSGEDKVRIFNTIKENNLIIHLANKLPEDVNQSFTAIVDENIRQLTANNHSATHLLHFMLREILGQHVEQKGSLVDDEKLRFDFSHFQKLSDEEIFAIERGVNKLIRQNIPLDEHREIPVKEAQDMGAMALFGEKYGEKVRVIRFGESVELCGGTHVNATGQIGFFKIISESAIAAGIRRIEAITAVKAEEFVQNEFKLIREIRELLGTGEPIKLIENLQIQNKELQKQIESFSKEKAKSLKQELLSKIEKKDGVNAIIQKIDADSAATIKDIAFQLKGEIDNLVLLLGADLNGKPHLALMISDNLVKKKNLNANQIIREIAKEIQGGGGGQPFFATAGGKNASGIEKALAKGKEVLI
ncbi:MAG: alanine--tRNA ligase [Bacteroidota bacterium]